MDKKTKISLTKHEVRVILHWLDVANGKWCWGSYEDIKEIYQELAEFAGLPKRWKWMKPPKDKEIIISTEDCIES